MEKESKDKLSIIGSTEIIKLENIDNVPAKIDTGADSSAVWASDIQVSKEGILSFCLFDKESPLYTGELIERREYRVVMVRNSSGFEQVRYRTKLTIVLNSHEIKTTFTLSDRGNNKFPVLIGRRAISGIFLVDVSKNPPKITQNRTNIAQIQEHLTKDPYEFHRNYMEKDLRKENK